KFLPQQAQARRLHGALVAKELHPHWSSLTDAPGTATCLPQSVQRISRLVEEDGWEIEQIESGFDQLGMGDYDLHPFLDLSCVPGFAFRRVHAGPQHCRAASFRA